MAGHRVKLTCTKMNIKYIKLVSIIKSLSNDY